MKDIVIIGGVGLLAYLYLKTSKKAPTSVSDFFNTIETGAKNELQQFESFLQNNSSQMNSNAGTVAVSKGNAVIQYQNQDTALPMPNNLPGQTLTTKPVDLQNEGNDMPPIKNSVAQPVISSDQQQALFSSIADQYVKSEGAPVNTITEPSIVQANITDALVNQNQDSSNGGGKATEDKVVGDVVIPTEGLEGRRRYKSLKGARY